MSKLYDSLTREASEEEFENMALQITEKDKENERKLNKIKRVGTSRPHQAVFGNESYSEENRDSELSDKGEWEDIINDDTYDVVYQEQEEHLNSSEKEMWTNTSYDFGDPLKFIGNPFDRALAAQEELIKCAKQAEEIFGSLQLDDQEVNNVVVEASNTKTN